jgi:hypothetical protein
MRTNKDFRKVRNSIDDSEQTKGKLVPKKERLSKHSAIDELEEDEEIGYISLKEKDSIADYYDEDDEYYEDDEEYPDDEEYDDDEYYDDEYDDDDEEYDDEYDEDEEYDDEDEYDDEE